MAVYQLTRVDRTTGLPVPIPGKWMAELRTEEGRFKSPATSKAAAERLVRRWKRGDTEGFKATGPKAPPPRLRGMIPQATAALYRDSSAVYRHDQTRAMEGFTGWAKGQAQGVDVSADWVSQRELLRWVDQLRADGLSPSTVNSRVIAVRSLLDWCHTRGHRREPAPKVERLAVQDVAPGYLTEAEEDQLVACLRGLGQPEVADFIRVACMTGMRRSELLELRRGDLGENQVLLRQQKSGTPGVVHVVPPAMAILQRRVPWGCTGRTLSYWLEKAKQELGWDMSEEERLRSLTLHSTRHTCATRLAKAGVDMRVIKEHLRHSEIRHTLRYTKLVPGLLAEKVQVLSRELPEDTRDDPQQLPAAGPACPPEAPGA